jgi:hypothetical protein
LLRNHILNDDLVDTRRVRTDSGNTHVSSRSELSTNLSAVGASHNADTVRIVNRTVKLERTNREASTTSRSLKLKSRLSEDSSTRRDGGVEAAETINRTVVVTISTESGTSRAFKVHRQNKFIDLRSGGRNASLSATLSLISTEAEQQAIAVNLSSH